MTDKTGTGALVFQVSPKLITPDLGTPSAIDLTNATGTLPVSSIPTGISVTGATGTLPVAALPAHASFSVHKNGTNQTGVPDSTSTQVTFSAEIYDIGSHFATNAWTPPAGLVHLSCGFVADAVTTTNVPYAIISLRKNGSDYKSSLAAPIFASISMGIISIDDIANGSDVYTVGVSIPNTGGTSTIRGDSASTWFTGHWISA